MQRISLSPKRIALGIALISVGLALLTIIPHPLQLQAPLNVLLPSLTTIFLCVTTIHLGVFILSIGLRTDLQKYFTKIFLIPIIISGVWTCLVALPIMLLPLPEEASILALSSSLLLLVFIVGYYEKWKTKHKKGSKGWERFHDR